MVKAEDSQLSGCGFEPWHCILDGVSEAGYYKLQWKNEIKVAKGGEAGATFDNSFFDNYFDFLRQFKNGSFLGPVFVHVTGRILTSTFRLLGYVRLG